MPFRRRIAHLAAAVLAVVALLASGALSPRAAALQAVATSTGVRAADLVTGVVGPVTASLDTSANAVPVTGTFRFGARIETNDPVEYIQARLRLLMPSGDLVYQKTYVDEFAKPGRADFTYERTLRDIGLDPGLYPVELAVRLSASGEVTETVLTSSLVVYDPDGEPLSLSVIGRITAQPLSDAEGKFTSDPAQFTRARNDATRIAAYVLDTPNARVALALAPSMLEEWRRVSGGYSFAGAEGEVTAAATDEVPRAYASALDTIARASATGRLEILTSGYSDPDPSELAAAGLTEDLTTQYDWGADALASALDATPSAGAVPAGGALPEAALPALARAGVSYVVIDSRRARRSSKPVVPGVYRSKTPSVTVLAADTNLARAVEASSSAAVRIRTYERLLESPKSPVTVVFDIGPGSLRSEAFVAALQQLDAQPWARLALPSDAAKMRAPTRAALRGHKPDADAPEDFWSTVAEARAWASALEFSLGDDDSEAARAAQNSLLAQSSAWSGFDGSWSPAGKGLTYAAHVLRTADSVFGKVDLSARTVTLAGNQGRVPVTIDNDTERELRVVLTARPGASLRVTAPSRQVMNLEPGENFVEIPVALSNAISSDIAIDLSAAGTRFATTEVTVRASYLDRIVMVGGLVLLLGGLLAFIIRRVRAAEAGEDEEPRA